MRGTLRERLLASAHRNATASALWVDGRQWDYATLFADAGRLAEQIDREVAPGLPLGILCQRDRISYLGILAAVLSGRPYVPLNPGFPAERLQAIAGLAGLGAILCSAETREAALGLIAELPVQVVLFGEEGEVCGTGTGRDQKANVAAATEDRTAYFMFTSGTTGTPKGVRVLERNLLAYLDGIAPITGLGPTDRCTQFFDLSFDLSVHDIFVTFCAGAELSVLPKQRSMEVVDFVAERGITCWFSVPSLAAFSDRLGHLRPDALPGLRLALFCGEPLAVALARRFAEAAPKARLWNLYGPTEATIALTAYEISRPDQLDDLAVVPLGFPIGDQQYRIEGDGTAAGELLLGGSQVTPGYINNPEQNASRFFHDADSDMRFYRTGDLAEPSASFGALFRGRIDDQVKINGYRVELMEIDAVLRVAADTPEVAAIPWPVSTTGHADQVVAFVTNPKATVAEIKKYCRRQLPVYMVPRRIVTIDRMPLSASGKIDRKALKQRLEDSKAGG
ncbi:MAG: AMP-binding protein [Rhodobacteraceae bacterium]|nr:AMP-binding protein [Paracoccaceae bacterium]